MPNIAPIIQDDCVAVDVSKDGWMLHAIDVLNDKESNLKIIVSSTILAEVVEKIHKQSDKNPFNNIIIEALAQKGLADVISKAIPFIQAAASMGGGPAGIALSVGAMIVYGTFKGYRVCIEWDFGKLVDPTDDEAHIYLKLNK